MTKVRNPLRRLPSLLCSLGTVDAYASWDLFLIFVSIAILIGGVVLLTNKKPEKNGKQPAAARPDKPRHNKRRGGDDEEAGLRRPEEAVWRLGEESDDDEEDTRRESHESEAAGERAGLIHGEEPEEAGSAGVEDDFGEWKGATHD